MSKRKENHVEDFPAGETPVPQTAELHDEANKAIQKRLAILAQTLRLVVGNINTWKTNRGDGWIHAAENAALNGLQLDDTIKDDPGFHEYITVVEGELPIADWKGHLETL